MSAEPYTYLRRYNYRGVAPLWANVLRILTRDLPAELDLIEQETAAERLPNIKAVYPVMMPQPLLPCVVVEPAEDDAEESDSGLQIGQLNAFDILIAITERGDLAQTAREIVEYKRAVRNVLWSCKWKDLTEGIICGPAQWDVRGGRYAWVEFGKETRASGRIVQGMRLRVRYSESVTR